MSMWEYIDKIMTHPDYDKSFNKVINSALLFGLPELYKRLFDTVEIDGEEKPVSVPNEYNENQGNGQEGGKDYRARIPAKVHGRV